MGKSVMKLYWVETEDHHEDWFVVAQDENAASTFFEEYEGYDSGDALATFVIEIPDGVRAESGWPKNELLKLCGAEIVRDETPRVIQIAGKKFCEGMLEYQIRQLSDDLFEALGGDRLNQTSRPTKT